jgi:hypothetical protein
MFYAYLLAEEMPNLALVHPLALAVSTGETTALAARSGTTPQLLSTASAQVVRRQELIGKSLSRAVASAIGFSKTSFHLNRTPLSVAVVAAPGLARHYVPRRTLSASVALVAGMRISSPFHIVAAASIALVAGVQRAITTALHAATAEAAGLLRQTAPLGMSASSASAASVRRQISARRQLGSDQSVNARVGLVRLFRVASPAIVARSIRPSKRAAVASAIVASLRRRLPFRIGATSAQATAAPLGRRSLFRTQSAALTQRTAIGRGLRDPIGLAGTQAPHLTQIAGRQLRLGSPETVRLTRSPSRLLSAQQSSVAALRRLFGTLRQVAANSLVALAPAALHRPPALLSSLTLVAHERGLIIRSRILTLAGPSVARLASHATLTLTQVVATAQAQVSGISRRASRRLAVVLVTALAITRRTGRHPLTVAQRSTTLSLRRAGKTRGVATALTATLRAAPVRALAAGVATTGVLFARAAAGRLKAVAQASGVQALRQTGHPLTVRTPQRIARGLGTTVRFRVAQPGVVVGEAARSLSFQVVHVQATRLTPWYHLFVPAWAYQQTTLLPPNGGPAEPMAFGAIDSQDRTTFAFDWSSRLRLDDAITDAAIVSIPPGLPFDGPVFVLDKLVEVTVGPFVPPELPSIYSLRCTVRTASGRRNSYSIPVPVRTL